MTSLNLPHDEAFQYVQGRRFCVSPNLNFQRQIEAYESIHKASLTMAPSGDGITRTLGVGVGKGANGANRRKRMDPVRDGDEDDVDDELRDRNIQAQRRKNADGDNEAHLYYNNMLVGCSPSLIKPNLPMICSIGI